MNTCFAHDLRPLPEFPVKWRAAVISMSLLVLAAPCWGQAGRVDAFAREQMQTWHIPGVSIGVVRDGKVLLAKGYGFANIELGASATADTVYEILSITKQFTAAAILVLVEEGKIGLDDTVAKYLPDSPTSWKDVTVRHLLTHTSGIMDFTDIPPFFEQLRLDATPDELLKAVKKRPLPVFAGNAVALLKLQLLSSGPDHREAEREEVRGIFARTPLSAIGDESHKDDRLSGHHSKSRGRLQLAWRRGRADTGHHHRVSWQQERSAKCD